ncbi:MAG TPA: DUF222 domain-containing protein [Acidimicrobiia bacterium]|nr:DUF222 domain-containing protein [Acidimicrobiia bacterium]
MFGQLQALVKKRRELDAAEADWLADIAAYDRSGDWHADGYQNASAAIRTACRLDAGVARGHVALARTLGALPLVTAAFTAGEISARHAAVIAHAYTPERAAEITNIEAVLVDLAAERPPHDLAAAVKYVTDAIDGDGGATNDDTLFARRRHHASRGLDGMLHVDGLYDPEAALIHEAAIAAELERDHRPNDTRLFSQRQADAVTNLFRQSLERGTIGTTRAVRPHITQVIHLDEHPAVRADTITRARLERHQHGRLSDATLERLLCDCDITRVLMTGTSEILDVGRATRTISPTIWKALVVRDQHCQTDGCTQPPNRCEAHHIHHWEHGGPTNLNNLQLLCWHHHRQHHSEEAKARARPG